MTPFSSLIQSPIPGGTEGHRRATPHSPSPLPFGEPATTTCLHTVCICVAFITKHSYKASWLCGDVASREGVGGTLVVMPLGTQSRDDPRLETVATLVKALRAFCHPLAWDTLHLRALQASMLRMFPTVTVADGGGRALQAAAVLDSASRNVARGAVASIVVSFTDVADERCVPACDSVFPSLFLPCSQGTHCYSTTYTQCSKVWLDSVLIERLTACCHTRQE